MFSLLFPLKTAIYCCVQKFADQNVMCGVVCVPRQRLYLAEPLHRERIAAVRRSCRGCRCLRSNWLIYKPSSTFRGTGNALKYLLALIHAIEVPIYWAPRHWRCRCRRCWPAFGEAMNHPRLGHFLRSGIWCGRDRITGVLPIGRRIFDWVTLLPARV